MRRLAVPLTLLTALVAAAPAHAGYGFAAQPAASTGNTPVSLASADFNGDGLPDLVSANCGTATSATSCSSASPSSLTVLLSNGSGGFTTSTLVDAGNPIAAYAGDLNNDGDADVAAADFTGQQVTLFSGDGAGGFTAQATSSLVNSPRGLDFATIDSGTTKDLIAPLQSSNNLQVKTNSGGFSFLPLSTTNGTVDARAIVARDFDGDGDADPIVALGNSGNLATFANSGGSLSPPTLTGIGGTPVSLTAADFNGDGDLDLAVATTTAGVAVLLGGSGLTFGDVATYPTGAGLGNTIAVTSADMNGDSIPDLVTRSSTGTVRVLDGRGDGTFRAVGTSSAGATGTFGSSSVVARDFTGDGVADIAVPNAGANTVTLLRSVGVVDVQSSADFDDTALGARSAAKTITIRNTGVAPMTLSTATLGGTSPGDFQIVGNCGGKTLAAGQSCDMLVRFAPTATGARSATVSFVQTDVPGSPQVVSVSGAGTAAPTPVVGPTGAQGPAGANGTNGATGAQGSPGTNGTNGLNGAVGPTGATGARGPAGRDAVVTCKPVGTKKVKVTCTVKLASSRSTSLRLVRGRTLYASGKVTKSGSTSLKRTRPLTSGRYVLEIRSRGKTTRQKVTITRS